jgi:type IV secretion system protein VirD4
MAVAGILGLVATAFLTGWSEYERLWPYVGASGVSPLAVLNAFDPPRGIAIIVGLNVAFVGYCIATRARGVGALPSPSLLRAASDNFGHADWLTMRRATQRFPGPDPAHGGLVVGEAYRVDRDRAARRAPFDPKDRRTWGAGGKAPLLIDPCREGATHALVFAGSNGFKTTSAAIPTLLAWTGAAVVLDPSREIGPMMRAYRERDLGHQVVILDPSDPASGGFNVLDWIDPRAPLAETHVEAVVGWISGENRLAGSSGGDFFRDKARELITCLLTDLLWDPDVPADQKTPRTLRARLVTPEDDMRDLLETIAERSHSAKARQLASTLKGAVKETYSGFYQNATRDTAWLSTAAYADLVSGASFRTRDLTGGKLTVFVQIPLHVLDNTPALGRVIIGALLNAVYEADGAVTGRVLFLLDEVARLGYMKVITQARDAGRKYGITMLLLYQSLGQLIEQWGADGKKSWYESSSWRLFAAIQDRETARELSDLCGEYGVVSTSSGDTEGSQSRGTMGASNSSGRSENRSEIKRALIKPEEIIQDSRVDEAFVMIRGSPPLRCGRAIYFRRREWDGLVGNNRFHRDPDAAG